MWQHNKWPLAKIEAGKGLFMLHYNCRPIVITEHITEHSLAAVKIHFVGCRGRKKGRIISPTNISFNCLMAGTLQFCLIIMRKIRTVGMVEKYEEKRWK